MITSYFLILLYAVALPDFFLGVVCSANHFFAIYTLHAFLKTKKRKEKKQTANFAKIRNFFIFCSFYSVLSILLFIFYYL